MKSASTNLARRFSNRTEMKKYRSERKGRRSFDTTVEYVGVGWIANQKTRTTKAVVRATLLPRWRPMSRHGFDVMRRDEKPQRNANYAYLCATPLCATPLFVIWFTDHEP